jgi:hypothetical protein
VGAQAENRLCLRVIEVDKYVFFVIMLIESGNGAKRETCSEVKLCLILSRIVSKGGGGARACA